MGDELSIQLITRIEERLDKRLDSFDGKLDALLVQGAGLTEKVEGHEGRLEAHTARLNAHSNAIDSLKDRQNKWAGALAVLVFGAGVGMHFLP